MHLLLSSLEFTSFFSYSRQCTHHSVVVLLSFALCLAVCIYYSVQNGLLGRQGSLGCIRVGIGSIFSAGIVIIIITVVIE